MRIFLGQTAPKTIALLSVAFAAVCGAPAVANSSASTAVDITAPIDEIEDDQLAKGDPGFRELFSRWTALDTAGPDPFAPVMAPTIDSPVSVPSRNPLNAGQLTSAYGMRVHPVLGRRKRHKGIDLAAPTGTPVYATADGAISRAERSRSYGLVIYIDHGAELETRYAHLSKLLVADGQDVQKGDLIGYVGSTGRSTGPHLHYEVRVEGVAVNPIPYMKEETTRAALSEEQGTDPVGRQRPGVQSDQLTGQGGQ